MAEIIGGERWMQVDTTAETNPGVKNGSQTLKPFRVVGGGIGLKENPQFIDVEEHANATSQPVPIKSDVAPAGTVSLIPSPFDSAVDYDPTGTTRSLFAFMLTAAKMRTAGLLGSFSLYDVFNGLVTREYLGCKVGGFRLGFGDNSPQLDFGIDLFGLHAGRLTTPKVTGDAGTFPSSRHWFIAQVAFQIGADLTVTTNNRTVNAFEAAQSNALVAKGKQVYYPSGRNDTKATGVQQLQEGELSLQGSIELTLADNTWYDRMIGGATGGIRILAAHPDSLIFTSSGTFSTTANPTILIAEDFTGTQIEAGDYVYLEDSSAANPDNWKKEVLRVMAVTVAGGGGVNSIQLETDGAVDPASTGRNQSFAAGSRIFTRGFQMRIPAVTVLDWEPVGGVREKVRQRVPWRAGLVSGQLYDTMVR